MEKKREGTRERGREGKMENEMEKRREIQMRGREWGGGFFEK